jgi:AsmA protein
MRRILLWVLALAGALVVLLLAAVLILPQIIDAESYLPKIESKVTEVTGRSFSIDKDVRVSVFPWVGVSFSNLQLGNPEIFGGGELIKVESFEARVKLLPLLTKKIEIDKFVLNGPEIQLIKLPDGSVNWSMGSKQAIAEQKQSEPQPQDAGAPGMNISSLQVGEFAITNGRLVYTDKGIKYTREIDTLNLRLQDVSLDKPITIDFQAQVDGKPMSLRGKVGPVGQEPGTGTLAFDLVAKAFNELEMNIRGEIIEPVQKQRFKVHLAVAAFSPRKLFEKLDLEMPLKTADPAVLNTFKMDITAEGSPAGLTLSNSTVTLDGSHFEIEATVKEMNKPDISFALALDSIDLDRYLPPASVQEQKSAGQGTRKDRAETNEIDYEPLRKLVLDGEITVGELVASGAKLHNMLVKVTGKDGVFDLNPLSFDLYQGSVALLGNFNLQKKTPVSRIELKTENVQVGPLLQDSLDKDIIRGSMNADARLQCVGDSASAIKESLQGSGNLTFLNGAIVGIDIAETGRRLIQGFGYQQPVEKPTTDFAELKIPFILTSGVFQTDDSLLLSPLLRVKAFGTANLVNENIDMKVHTKIVGTLKGQGDTAERTGVTVPLVVKGTLSEPKISLDMSSLANDETLKEAITNPDSVKEKIKSFEETGKSLLQGFGIGN